MPCPYCSGVLNEDGVCCGCFEKVETYSVNSHPSKGIDKYRVFLDQLPIIKSEMASLQAGIALPLLNVIGLPPK